MKKIIPVILLFITYSAYPQRTPFYAGQWAETDSTMETFSMINYFANQYSWDKKKIAQNKIHISKSQIYNFDKKGNQKLSRHYVNTFDIRGNRTSTLRYNKKNELRSSSFLIFNDSSKILSYVDKNRKGIITTKDSATYNNAGKQTSEFSFRRKGIMVKWKTLTTYNEKGETTEIDNFKYNKKGKEKSQGKYITIYTEDGSKGETKWYNGKGRLKYTWRFDCNPEGVLERPIVKDTTKVCVKYDYGVDGSKVRTLIYTNKKNHITKTIEKYNPKGYMTEYTNYNRKNIITDKYIYSYDTDNNCTVYVWYKRGGEKIKNKYTMEYDSNNQLKIYCRYHHADKLRSKYTYDYDEKGMYKEMIYYKKGVKKHSLHQCSYEYF